MKSRMYQILHGVQVFFFRFALWLEVGIALLIAVGCVMELLGAPQYFISLGSGGFSAFMQYLFDILIGVEMIKMLSRQDLDSMVEVLLFVVARSLIIGHTSTLDFLIGVAAMAGLFGIRKFLFIRKEGDREHSDYLQKDR